MTDESLGLLVAVAEGLLAGTLSNEEASRSLKEFSDVAPRASDLTDSMYHFIADADIRARDAAYDDWQRKHLRRLLDALASQ